jgi:hypothetical protein
VSFLFNLHIVLMKLYIKGNFSPDVDF